MKEPTVRSHIRRWLKEKDAPLIPKSEHRSVDFLIGVPWGYDWLSYIEQIECKGTESDVYRAIGQSLTYAYEHDSIPTYLAVPQDCSQLTALKQILDFFDLPIGVMLVDEKGQVSTERKSRGKVRHYKLYEIMDKDGIHTLITKPTHPILHFGAE